MKKLIQPMDLPLVVPALGCLGATLRLWQIRWGIDEKGLFVDGHLSGWLILALLALTAVTVFVLTRDVGSERSYAQNFPASPFGALGTVAAAVGIFVAGLQQLLAQNAITLDRVCGIIGLAAGPALLMAAQGRLKGQKVTCLSHIPASLFLALWLFTKCRIWGAEPELWVFFPDMLAVLMLMIASYHLTTFDVNMGKRGAYLFWALMACCCCITAIPGSENKLLLITGALWMISNLCVLSIRERSSARAVSADVPEEAPEEKQAEKPRQQPAPRPVRKSPEKPAPKPAAPVRQERPAPIVPDMPEFEEEKPAPLTLDEEVQSWLKLIDELEQEEK